MIRRLVGRRSAWRLAPDGLPRPNAPFGRGPSAARLLAVVIDASASLGGRLPVSVAHRLAWLGGHLEWATRPGKRRRLATNLAHAIGLPPGAAPVRRLVRGEFVNEARRSADLLWTIARPDDLLAGLTVDGAEHLVSAVEAGRGVVLTGLHLGGWEVATAVPAAIVGAPATVIVADDWLAWAMQHVRARAGLRVLYRGAPALAALRVLQRHEILLVLGDDARGAVPRRYRVRFCDGWADLPAGVVGLARLAGSPILPFSVLPLGPRRWAARIEPPIEPPDRHGGVDSEVKVLQELADRWSAQISAHSAHWAASFDIAWAG